MNKHLIVLLIALAAIAGIYWFDGFSPAEEAQQPRDTLVRATRVGSASLADSFEALGTASAYDSVAITASQSGKVARIFFSDNQSVTKGDLLVALESGSEEAAVEEAEVALAEAERVLNHYRRLIKTSAVSQTLLEEQQTQVAAAKARLAAARAELADFTIAAPFSGVLGFRQISPGTLVEPGDVITTLDAIATLKLNFSVPEYWVGKIRLGDRVPATSVAWPERIFDAEITAVANRVDPVTRALQVQAHLDNRELRLKPGMLLTVMLSGAPRDTLVVSEEALVQEGAERFVFVIGEGGVVARTPVETGIRKRGQIEIVAGLAEGDQVVREGVQKVTDGTKVKILPDEPDSGENGL